MKITKRFILTLAAILGMTGAWAQDAEEEVAVTKTANNNEWTLTMPASDVELEIEYYATTPFDLTVGESAHGTVQFTVGGEVATQACYDDVVTVTVTPEEGYSAKDVTVRAYTSWEAAGARRRAPGLLDEIAVTKNEADGTWTFTMPEANVWVVASYTKDVQDAWIEAIADHTYTGEALEPTVTVKDGETTLTLGTDYTVAYSNNTVAGTATVTVTAVESSDYSGTATATFIIQKANTAVTTVPVGKNLTYTGEPQALVEAGTATGGEMQYSLDGTTYSTDIPTATEQGSYTIYYKVVGDANHNDTEAQSVAASITGIIFSIEAGSYSTHITNQAISLSAADAAAGVKLYTVTAADKTAGTVTLTELTSVDANTPMVVYNPTDADRNVVFIPTTGSMEAQPADIFKGTIDSKTFTADEMAAADHYVLSGQNFVWVKDAGTLAGGKCWIELDKSAGASRLSIVFDGKTTGVNVASAVSIEESANAGYYDLNGRKLSTAPAQKGIYVKNGKKVVVK